LIFVFDAVWGQNNVMTLGMMMMDGIWMTLLQYQGWWHYQYCHNQHARQYHPRTEEERKKYPEKEQDYYLGKFPTKKLKKQSARSKSGASSGSSGSSGKGLGLAEWEIVETELDGKTTKYLKAKWGDGTLCDVNNAGARTVELQVWEFFFFEKLPCNWFLTRF
jgi:hypothetical protein